LVDVVCDWQQSNYFFYEELPQTTSSSPRRFNSHKPRVDPMRRTHATQENTILALRPSRRLRRLRETERERTGLALRGLRRTETCRRSAY